MPTIAGGQLDATVAERTFDCDVIWTSRGGDALQRPECACEGHPHSSSTAMREHALKRYSSSWEALGQILDHFREYRITRIGKTVECELSTLQGGVEHVYIQEAPSATVAACFAAIDAARGKLE